MSAPDIRVGDWFSYSENDHMFLKVIKIDKGPNSRHNGPLYDNIVFDVYWINPKTEKLERWETGLGHFYYYRGALEEEGIEKLDKPPQGKRK